VAEASPTYDSFIWYMKLKIIRDWGPSHFSIEQVTESNTRHMPSKVSEEFGKCT